MMASSVLPSFAALNSGDIMFDGYEGFIPYDDDSIDDLLASSNMVVSDQDGTLANPIIGNEETGRDGVNGVVDYEVQPGDTLGGIADRFEIKVSTIQQVNGLSGQSIKPGQKLKIIPVDGLLYIADGTETLEELAKKYSLDVGEIADQNSLTEKAVLQKGERVILPGAQPIKSVAPERQTVIVDNTPKTKIEAAKSTKTSTKISAPATTTITQKKDFDVATKKGSKLVWPAASPVITQNYHYGHPGIDIAYVSGDHTTAIVATTAGTVIQAAGGYNGGYGNVVVIDHGNGMQTRSAHLREIYVTVGQKVRAGQAIGWMGRTGRVYGKTGKHLHFEVIVNKRRMNPMAYL